MVNVNDLDTICRGDKQQNSNGTTKYADGTARKHAALTPNANAHEQPLNANELYTDANEQRSDAHEQCLNAHVERLDAHELRLDAYEQCTDASSKLGRCRISRVANISRSSIKTRKSRRRAEK